MSGSGITCPRDWNAGWLAAKADCAVNPAWLAWIGDSYSQGQNASEYGVTSFRALVRSWLLEGFPRYADFYPVTDSAAYIGHYSGTPPWLIAANPNLSWAGWFATPCLYGRAALAGVIATFTTPDPCTALDVIYASNNAGTFSYSLDGGPWVLVTPPALLALTKLSLVGLANRQHTLALGQTSAPNVLVLQGVSTYGGEVGIGQSVLCYSGAAASEWASTTSQPPYPKSICLSGRRSVKDTAGGFGFPMQPALAVIALGINDLNMQTDPALFTWALADLCVALRAGRADCSLLIMANSAPNPSHGDVRPFTGYQNWWAYLHAMQAVAAAHGACFVNIDDMWGSHGAALGYQAANNQHPLDAGHAFVAQVLKQVLA